MKPGTVCITFSGIDGAGKSTQIDFLCATMAAAGARIARLSFWDDVVVWSSLREYSSHQLLKSERGIGAPGRPVARRDKNVRSWYLTACRLFLYLLDALHLRFVLRRKTLADEDVVVFDRYIYDELANLPLKRSFFKAYVRLLLLFAPVPNIAYLIDADPIAANRRKPEYPVKFVQTNRQAYLTLSRLVRRMVVIDPAPVLEVQGNIVRELLKLRAKSEYAAFLDTLNTVPFHADTVECTEFL